MKFSNLSPVRGQHRAWDGTICDGSVFFLTCVDGWRGFPEAGSQAYICQLVECKTSLLVCVLQEIQNVLLEKREIQS